MHEFILFLRISLMNILLKLIPMLSAHVPSPESEHTHLESALVNNFENE